MSQAAKLPGISDFFKKIDFLETVLPQAAQLPRTGDLFKQMSIFRKSSAPGSAAAPDR